MGNGQPHAEQLPVLPVWGTVARGWAAFRQNLRLFLPISFVGILPSVLQGILAHSGVHFHPLSVVLFVAGWLVGWWVGAALIVAASHAHDAAGATTARSCFVAARGVYWRFVGTSILYFWLGALGLLLLVVPGVYWYVVYSFATYVAVLDTERRYRPFERSLVLVRGSFWRVFAISLIMFTVAFAILGPWLALMHWNRTAGTVWLQVACVFVSPFSVAVLFEAYSVLVRREAVVAREGKGEADVVPDAERARIEEARDTKCSLVVVAGLAVLFFLISPWAKPFWSWLFGS